MNKPIKDIDKDHDNLLERFQNDKSIQQIQGEKKAQEEKTRASY